MNNSYYRCKCCGQENDISLTECTRCHSNLTLYGEVQKATQPIDEINTSEEIRKSKRKHINKKSRVINNKKRKSRLIVCVASVAIIFVLMIYVFSVTLSEVVLQYNMLEEDYSTIKRQYDDIYDEYKFYNEYARIVPKDGLNVYHRFDCSERARDVRFNIYNVATAKTKAEPCQNCCADD